MASRIAIKLVLLSTFTLAAGSLLNIFPSPKQAEIRRKSIICEFLAITSSILAENRNVEVIEKNFDATVARYPDIVSACIRDESGEVLHQIGDHAKHWHLESDDGSTLDNIYVPIKSDDQLWATVELSFARKSGITAAFSDYPYVTFGLFTIVVNCLMFRWYLKRAFSYLDPSRSVPMHVRATLDTFAEGVAVLDNDQRIVLANDKFKQHVGRSEHELLGQQMTRIPWEPESSDKSTINWKRADGSGEGKRLTLQLGDDRRTFLVNTSAILGDDGKRRGMIASFDDITPLERKREELSSMLMELKSSKEELSVRNKELQYLATRDPLTGCLNRRTFFEIFDKQWNAARRHQSPLSCFMVDLDHFKSINDNHGHSMGDEVLRRAAETIQATARESDIVCRYGGEEFCVLLPQTDTDQAASLAERMRQAIEQLQFDALSVTSSLGVSSIALGAADPQGLLDQADECLYAAKRAGRNQVVRWDAIPSDVPEVDESPRVEFAPTSPTSEQQSIPYPAVASLLSALAFRDVQTAAHSKRVADLCVVTASGILSAAQTYELEVAALLHDIGKIGVPDAILLKPGPLTREEWETMELHDRIGVEIVEAAFSNQRLVDIVRCHHATYSGHPDTPHYPVGNDIPIGARIVTIADAYDAMVSDRVYRKGRSQQAAFEELRLCAGTQFDPMLVERFIEVVGDHEPVTLATSSKQAALQVGLQIERLVQAVDDGDNAGIRAFAARLETTAARDGISEIESVAAEIRQSVDEDGDLIELLQLVHHLLELCRAVQNVYTDVPDRRLPQQPV